MCCLYQCYRALWVKRSHDQNQGLPTSEYKSKQPHDPVVPKLPCTRILVGPSKSGKTVALISMILKQYRGCFERIYVFSPSINVDDGWRPVPSESEGSGRTIVAFWGTTCRLRPGLALNCCTLRMHRPRP